VDDDWMLTGHGGVLVGTNGSSTARKAVEAGARLALAYDRELIVATGMRMSPARLAAGRSEDDQLWHHSRGLMGEEIVTEAIHHAKELTGGAIPVWGRFEVGEPASVLLRLAREVDAAAIVIGNIGQRRRWTHRWSVPDRVMRGAHGDVVIVDTEAWHRRGELVEAPSYVTLRRCA
jgi:nucleotide-binding universal stress UspA family protein